VKNGEISPIMSTKIQGLFSYFFRTPLKRRCNMPQISNVTDREKLKPRREPYWQKISKGCYVGYRKMTAGGDGTWLARCLPDGEKKQSYSPLGEFSDLSDYKRFDAAQEAARKWFMHIGKGGSNEAVTIKEVCIRYVEQLNEKGKSATAEELQARHASGKAPELNPIAKDTQRRFNAYVLNNAKLATTQLQKLTPDMLAKWRRELARTPTKSGPNRGGERSNSSLNRDMTCFRSALNLALKDGLCTSDFAWREKLKQIEDADNKRDVYLDLSQRKALAAKAPADLALLIQALSLLPVRPGALAQLKVGDYDRRLKTLRIGKDKTGARTIALPDNTAKFFANLCTSRMPNLPLLKREDGKAWDKDSWKKPIKAAVKATGLPENITLYALRHSTITDLVHGGLDLLTVGQVSGTSQRMIEKHYGHLVSEQSRKALSMLSI
jgi:integrase